MAMLFALLQTNLPPQCLRGHRRYAGGQGVDGVSLPRAKPGPFPISARLGRYGHLPDGGEVWLVSGALRRSS